MRFVLLMLLSVFAVSCGPREERINKRTPPKGDTELEKLKQVVLKLQGTIDQLNDFVASDFSDCGASLPPFESKICKIAQTATAEQQILFSGQLAEVVKIFQNELYGSDCIRTPADDTFDVGCPAAGSIVERIEAIYDIEDDIVDIQADVTALQADVLSLEADLASLNSRLDDFDGSGSSIETVIGNLAQDLADLEDRVDDIEDSLNNADLWKSQQICRDTTPSTGPMYETYLIRGDREQVVAYVRVSGTVAGLGVIAEAGGGHQYKTTTLNTQACKFRIYDFGGQLNVCWHNTNRNANSATIDTACDFANSLASPTASCTCAF
jgi:hypothetical protein